MNWDTLFDPLFRAPFAAGLLLALVLPEQSAPALDFIHVNVPDLLILNA